MINKKSSRLLIVSMILVSVFFVHSSLNAQQVTGTNNSGGEVVGTNSSHIFSIKNPLKADSIYDLVQTFVEIFSLIAIIGAVLALIWVGFQFILARGNVSKMSELKDKLIWIVVGVAIIIGARLLINIVINTLSSTGVVDQTVIQSTQKAINGK
jgi:ABC-type cobalt transport system substrate-binding protein